MAPKLTVFRVKTSQTTYFVNVTAATTLKTLRESLLAAITAFPTEETPKDLKPQFIALWKLKNKEDYTDPDRWSLLEDEKSGADKWGLTEGSEIAASFGTTEDDAPEPTVIRPIDEDEEE